MDWKLSRSHSGKRAHPGVGTRRIHPNRVESSRNTDRTMTKGREAPSSRARSQSQGKRGNWEWSVRETNKVDWCFRSRWETDALGGPSSEGYLRHKDINWVARERYGKGWINVQANIRKKPDQRNRGRPSQCLKVGDQNFRYSILSSISGFVRYLREGGKRVTSHMSPEVLKGRKN